MSENGPAQAGAAEAGEPREPRRFFFVHLQKTAGTSLFIRVKRHFREASVYPNSSDGDVYKIAPQVSVSQLLARWQLRQAEIEIIAGHFPLCTAELLNATFTTLTVVREPVDRTLSFLRHHQRLWQTDRDVPLEEIYEDEPRFHGLVHNHMVKMFSLTAPEVFHAMQHDTWGLMTRVDFTPDHLTRAKERLSAVDVVGLQDRFEEFCGELESRFGWRLGEPLRANKTVSVDVPRSFRERIARDNAMDVELYEYARELYARRRSRLASHDA